MIKNVLEINNLKFGGKAFGLNRLNSFNVTVPTAYGIDNDSIKNIIEGKKKDINDLSGVLSEFSNDTKFAIRSSASNEDGNEKSFAGMYESVLNVENNLESVINAIKIVNNSSLSSRIKSYNDEKSKMNIVLQEMINPIVAGVCFTNAIDLDGSNSIYIEYVEGLGESLVSGKKTAKSIVISLSDFSYRCDDEQNRDLFNDLVGNLKKIRMITEESLDIEWCIGKDKKAYFVQARPVTKQIIIREKLSTGAIASAGYCNGNIHIINEDEDDEVIAKKIKNFPEGGVLLAKTTDTNYVPAMKKSSGIITTEGSVLSHAAIIAREFGIPCITGYKDALNLFKEGKNIIIDTNNKSIIYDNKKIIFGNGKEINLLELYNFDNIIEEKVDDNVVLVESVNGEFGIHISEDLSQDEIDKIEIIIRKKYKKSPIILADQKYLWYTEFKRYKNFPDFKSQCDEALKICENFDSEKLELFVNNLLTRLDKMFSTCSGEYENVYLGEYAQALHFLINLYMCNGCAMKAIYDYIEKNKLNSIQDLLVSDTPQSIFLKKIENIRGSVWKIFVDNGWSDDNYYDYREEKIASAINFSGNEEDSIDEFYKNLKICEYNANTLVKKYY